MTDKQIIIDGVDVSGCAYLGYENACRLKSASVYTVDCVDNTNCYYKQLKRAEQRIVELNKTIQAKEQECERLKEERDTWHFQWEKRYEICESLSEDIDKLCEQLEAYKMEAEEGKEINAELKAEVKSKTEYIQEQRDIINQYSQEIEMYKKCQGKRASKREEELKAENKHINDLLNQALKELEKTRETLTEIKEIAENRSNYPCGKCIKTEILQKISECEGNDE